MEADGIILRAEDLYKYAMDTKEKAYVRTEELQKDLNDKIDESKKVSMISELTESIIAIASQTNLLALNASIVENMNELSKQSMENKEVTDVINTNMNKFIV